MQSAVASYPLPDLVHVLGQDVVHVLQVGSQELPLRFTSVLLFFTKDQNRNRHDEKNSVFDHNSAAQRHDVVLEGDDGRRSTDVS